MQRRRPLAHRGIIAALKGRLRFLFVLLPILLIAHRSPAPIVEQQETPPPAPTAEASKPAKTKRKSVESSQESKPTEAAKPKEPEKPKDRFAGTWSGKISQGIIGDMELTLTFKPGARSVSIRAPAGDATHDVTNDGATASWRTGLLNDMVWTFTPSSDGTTAQVTAKAAFVNGSAFFKRGGVPVMPKTASEFPIAKPVPEKPGFVYNPFDPTSRIFIDVRGKPSGSKLVDPKSGKTFIVP